MVAAFLVRLLWRHPAGVARSECKTAPMLSAHINLPRSAATAVSVCGDSVTPCSRCSTSRSKPSWTAANRSAGTSRARAASATDSTSNRACNALNFALDITVTPLILDVEIFGVVFGHAIHLWEADPHVGGMGVRALPYFGGLHLGDSIAGRPYRG